MKFSVETKIAALKHAIGLIQGGSRRDEAWYSAADKYGVDKSSLHRWFKAVSGQPQEEWKSLLAPKYKGRTKTSPVSDEALEFFINTYSAMRPSSVRLAYQKTLEVGASKGWEIPSMRTMERRMRKQGIEPLERYDYQSVDI